MSMADRDGKIWMDGKLIDWRDAKIHVLTHTLHYGMGVFEGVRAYKTADGGTSIFRLQEHTKRLLNSAKIFQMDVPFDHETLACFDLVGRLFYRPAVRKRHPAAFDQRLHAAAREVGQGRREGGPGSFPIRRRGPSQLQELRCQAWQKKGHRDSSL